MAQRRKQQLSKEMAELIAESRKRKAAEAQDMEAAMIERLGQEQYEKLLNTQDKEANNEFAEWRKNEETAKTERQRALDRIGFDRADWNQLNWYVEFANKDLSNLSLGEQLNLNIELSAVLEKLGGSTQQQQPAQVAHLQKLVLRHLFEMAEVGRTEYGPCEIYFQVALERIEEKDRRGRWISRLVPYPDQMIVPPRSKGSHGYDEQYLLVHLIKLLGKLGGMIRRCPHCSRIFLQFRRHAEFCSRKCQSIQFVQDKRREVKQAGIQADKSGTKKSGKTKSSKEDRHGKTRRQRQRHHAT